jgi:hypothetical protein
MNLVAPKAAVKHELMFNKLASEQSETCEGLITGITRLPFT